MTQDVTRSGSHLDADAERAAAARGAKGPDELRRQIERTRHELGDTVEQLAGKMDVKARARARADDLRDKAGAMTVQLRSSAAHAGRTGARYRRPVLVTGAAGAVVVASVMMRRYGGAGTGRVRMRAAGRTGTGRTWMAAAGRTRPGTGGWRRAYRVRRPVGPVRRALLDLKSG
ncbi:DUF3618 domain-containing protein [Streptomyces viridosporus]|uniref:DUF3618 domain-containing protein n=1 Tax=Streptomyces viridosporus TaxID=67581 RepID=UPI0009C15164|nr:DUF3618 domain-containing protein [Streptomyces viridosporus]